MVFFVCGACCLGGQARGTRRAKPLDPARDAKALHAPPASTLRAQFIWTLGDAAAHDPAYQSRVRGQNDKIAPHFFRVHFNVAYVPRRATLYIAEPRAATVTLNDRPVLQFGDEAGRGKGFNVEHAPVADALRPGDNVLAVEEVRGHSSLHTGANPVINQVTYGEVLAVKIVPGDVAVDAAPLLVSDGSWRSSLKAPQGWTRGEFDDSGWAAVQTLGVLGSRSDFLQWNADAGLYAWPGYAGIGPAMRTFRLSAAGMRDVVGRERMRNARALLGEGAGSFKVEAADAPLSLTLDFGKEVSGRIHFVSEGCDAVRVETSYGESAEEALNHPYLGVRSVTVAPRGEAYGPKSAFRFVRLTFPAGGSSNWKTIEVQGIAYPVRYLGSFESSDPLLNRIWETGAYTAHLCMQEGIWDAPKRDRGRWMGDLDVSGRVISSVFADRTLMEQTMSSVIGPAPVTRDVNTIAGYSALWITGQADFYRHLGDLAYLKSQHERLLQLLHVMDAELNADDLFTNPNRHKVFVDWSEGFSSDTPEARAATHLEFYLAYKEAAYLLGEMNDASGAGAYREKAERLRLAAQTSLLDGTTGTFGDRWQENAMAVVSGAATEEQRTAIWSKVLSRIVDQPSEASLQHTVITPYYGFYALSAMALLGHRPEALQWMREYWGGMLAEGATSFWEAYDPRWPKQDFHRYLQADGKEGYYVSLAHGWSSGPTAWLMQEILGIKPVGAGFHEVILRPDLAGLTWARGAEPTPRGLIRVWVTPETVRVSLPPETKATVVLPFPVAAGAVLENGRPIRTSAAEDGSRSQVTLQSTGVYTFRLQRGGPR